MTLQNFRWIGWCDEDSFFKLLIAQSKWWAGKVEHEPVLTIILSSPKFHVVKCAGKVS